MKKHLTAALAASLLFGGAGAAAAQSQWDRGHYDNGQYQGRDYRQHDGRDRGRYEGQDRGRYEGRDHGRHEGWNYNRGWRSEWRRGARMDYGYWSHGQRVDWRHHHLRRPPYGYEWRQVDGNYVLGAVATGLIADLIMHNNY